MEFISKSAAREFYHSIQKESLQFLTLKMNYEKVIYLKNRLLGGTKLSLSEFFMLQSFYEEWKKEEAFSFSNPDGVFRKVQTTFYYKQLLNYIDSPCFQRLSKPRKDKVTAEQIRINKQLNNL